MKPIVPEGLNLFPFQKKGVNAIVNFKSLIVADEMGLGKTIQTIVAINYLYRHQAEKPEILVICPASLKQNWVNEFKKWLTLDLTVSIVSRSWEPADIMVINYDILYRWRLKLKKRWDMIVADECHYLKNASSRRTRIVFGWGNGKPLEADRKLLLSGTPLLNKPFELYPLLHYLYPAVFPSKAAFGNRYCQLPGGFRRKYQSMYDGASLTGELNMLLKRHIMLRRTKDEVLKDLPEKIKHIIELDTRYGREGLSRERELIRQILADKKITSFTEIRKVLQRVNLNWAGQVSRIRKETALLKVEPAIYYLKTLLTTADKIVVFAWHREVIARLMAAFPAIAVSITGETPTADRQSIVDRFQIDPGTRLFIGNISAAGVGLNLTAASIAVFVEMDWTPARNTQAEDRIHRIGQKNSVIVNYLVFPKSLDSYIAHVNCDKQIIIDEILA